jgi:site-specific DNA recombinase
VSESIPPRQGRCAIYTRKSTEEGLEQAFNSLDAQREACEAYILSQKHEGWTTLPHPYDDGGFSGGSMDRPGLSQLLADVAAGKIDVVVVYKVDRLTRALADFARIVAIFDAAGVSFVSVTQAFNTTTSMGRLTLNVLLSFAQFEREVTAERVRDKIAASKAKGMWMGGVVPIGYRAEARSLQPVPDEAALVQRIFTRYLALGSVQRLKAELDGAGIRTPQRLHRSGRSSGRAAFSRGRLYNLLANPLFVGRIRHRDQVHGGQHPPIIDEALWQAVQDRLASNRQSRSMRGTAERPSPLAGRLFDPDGRKMRPSHARKNGRRYRYYVSTDLVVGSVAACATGWRIPARELEAAVGRAVAARLREPGLLSEVLRLSSSAPDASSRLIGRISEFADRLDAPASAAGLEAMRLLITRVELSQSDLRAEVSLKRLNQTTDEPSMHTALSDFPPFLVIAALRLQRRGPELRIVLQGPAAPPPKPDPLLVRRLIEARVRAADYLDLGQDLTVSAIARREGSNIGDVSRSLQLAFLAPDLVEAILDGTQPIALTPERLKRAGELPLLWDEQRAILGVDEPEGGDLRRLLGASREARRGELA